MAYTTQGSRCVNHVPTQRQMSLLGRENTLVRQRIEWVPQGEAGRIRVSSAAIDRNITDRKETIMENGGLGKVKPQELSL